MIFDQIHFAGCFYYIDRHRLHSRNCYYFDGLPDCCKKSPGVTAWLSTQNSTTYWPSASSKNSRMASCAAQKTGMSLLRSLCPWGFENGRILYRDSEYTTAANYAN